MTELDIDALTTGNEYIAFRVGHQDICVDIMSVREIRGWTEETILPHAPSFVRGVINLRGTVLPIVDLAQRLGFDPTPASERHVIIVAQMDEQIVGLLVEAVSEILTIDPAEIQETPEIVSDATRQFIHGTTTIDERLVSVMNVQNVLPIVVKKAA